jgi:hypothetical protein
MGRHQAKVAEQAARLRRVNDRRVLKGIFWVLRVRVWPRGSVQ